MGYDVRDLGDGERILAAAMIEKFVTRADGELELLTSGSTKAGRAGHDARGRRSGAAVAFSFVV